MRAIIAETENFSSEAVEALELFSEVHMEDLTQEKLSWALDTFEVFWFRLRFKLTRDHLFSAKKCRYILTAVTGLDHIDLEACMEFGIHVISLKGERDFLLQVRATAEHTMALTFAMLRNVSGAIQHTQQGNWNREPFKGHEIYGKKIGILGVGRLGSITAGFFHSLGAEVYGYDPVAFDNPFCKSVETPEELFEKSWLVSIHVNLNSKTRHLVGKELLSLMPKASWLVNTSRGQLIDSHALIESLENGTLAGAACDVIENEFEPLSDALLTYGKANPNQLILTPHIGGNTFESFSKTELFLVKKLKEKVQQ